MKFFSKAEIKAILLTFGLLVIVLFPNLLVSLRRARDVQRKADLSALSEALNKYQIDFGSFPLSKDGMISACAPVEIIKQLPKDIVIFSSCRWGKDSFKDINDEGYPPYLRTLPADPLAKEGPAYYYLSDGKQYQIFGTLEGVTEAEYDPRIVKRSLPCGTKTCNFGKSYGNLPLDKSIEEYENELKK